MAPHTIERQVEPPVADLEALFRGRYLSVTSFKRDGTGVATPVWFVHDVYLGVYFVAVLAMLPSTNPVGSVLDHAAMHVTAVAHDDETHVRLPPPTEANCSAGARLPAATQPALIAPLPVSRLATCGGLPA